MTDYLQDLEDSYFANTIARDLFRTVMGDLIGVGQYRQVYEWLPDKSLVAKIETGSHHFTNVLEYEAWQRVCGTDFAPWFAPVREISVMGTLILQERTTPLSARELPKKVPAFFTDIKPGNWGWLGDRVVCHDYGIHNMLEMGMTKRMRAVEWKM